MLSQFVYNQNRRKNKRLLGELHDFPEGSMSVGRLDENSEGLLLITTDGKFSADIRSKTVEKEYHVMVEGEVSDADLEKLRSGVEISIDGSPYQTLPSKARRLDPVPEYWPPARIRSDRHPACSWLSITVTEGKFKQVRKMTAAIGHPTVRLIRVRIGDFELGEMKPGEVKQINV